MNWNCFFSPSSCSFWFHSHHNHPHLRVYFPSWDVSWIHSSQQEQEHTEKQTLSFNAFSLSIRRKLKREKFHDEEEKIEMKKKRVNLTWLLWQHNEWNHRDDHVEPFFLAFISSSVWEEIWPWCETWDDDEHENRSRHFASSGRYERRGVRKSFFYIRGGGRRGVGIILLPSKFAELLAYRDPDPLHLLSKKTSERMFFNLIPTNKRRKKEDLSDQGIRKHHHPHWTLPPPPTTILLPKYLRSYLRTNSTADKKMAGSKMLLFLIWRRRSDSWNPWNFKQRKQFSSEHGINII